jgi:hypothetical protein
MNGGDQGDSICKESIKNFSKVLFPSPRWKVIRIVVGTITFH